MGDLPPEKRNKNLVPSCNCIEELRGEIHDWHGVAYHEGKPLINVDYLNLGWSFKHETMQGELSQRWTHKGINFRFCPLCGKEYLLKEEEEE